MSTAAKTISAQTESVAQTDIDLPYTTKENACSLCMADKKDPNGYPMIDLSDYEEPDEPELDLDAEMNWEPAQ